MFEVRTAPVYLALGAVALACWTALSSASALPLTFGWALAGMVALYVVSIAIDRAARPARAAAHILEHTTQVNAARVAAPRATSSEDSVDRRR
jgi:hypothetical protein